MTEQLFIRIIPCLADNYAYFLRDRATGQSALIDPSEADAVGKIVEEEGGHLNWILLTHHHHDHIGGTDRLRRYYKAKVAGAGADATRLPSLDKALAPGDIFQLGNSPAQILDVSGHTIGHIAFHFVEANALFCGDSLFALGCGRIFEGTALMMWQSLSNIRQLPEETQIYCGHEYTMSNAEFAQSLEPDNKELAKRCTEFALLRKQNRPTIPVTLKDELATNPFLRADDMALQARLKLEGGDPAAVFAEIRRRKDSF